MLRRAFLKLLTVGGLPGLCGGFKRAETATVAHFELLRHPEQPGWVVRALIRQPGHPDSYAASWGRTPEEAWAMLDKRSIKGYLKLPGLAHSVGETPWLRRWPQT